MEIHPITLTGDEHLDWINSLSSKKKKYVLQCFDDATKHGGGVFIDQIEERENLFCFSILIYLPSHPHAITGVLYQAPATPQGLADLEFELHRLNAATGGIIK